MCFTIIYINIIYIHMYLWDLKPWDMRDCRLPISSVSTLPVSSLCLTYLLPTPPLWYVFTISPFPPLSYDQNSGRRVSSTSWPENYIYIIYIHIYLWSISDLNPTLSVLSLLCDQITGRRVWSIGRRWVPSTSPSSYTHSPSRWDTLGRYVDIYMYG